MASSTAERIPSTAAAAFGAAASTPHEHRRDSRRWFALAFIVTANVTVFGGVTIMNVALPAAQDDLGLSDSARQWVVTIFSLTFGSLILLGGRLGDTFGLRRTMVAGLVGYGVASAAGAAAPASAVLLAARAGQGATAAVVAATALALLSRSFPDGPDREKAFGVLGTVMGLGGAGAFVVGGALTELSWRWCLAVSVPLVGVAAVGIHRTASGDAPAARRLDLRGAALITASIALVIFAFDRGATSGWATAPTLVSLAAGLVLLVAFVAAEAHAPVPILPLHIVADRGRAPVYVAVFLLGLSLFAGFFLMTFYLQDVLGYSPLKTGFAFLPFGAAAMAASKLIGPAMRRWPAPGVLLVGLASTAAGAAYLTRADTSSGYLVAVVPAFVLYGLGATTVMVTASNRATIGVGDDVGVASAGVGASQQIGGALGTALLGSIAASATAAYERTHGLADGHVEASVHGLTRATAVSAVIVVVGAAGAVLLARPASRRRAGSTQPLPTPPTQPAPCAGD